MPRLGHARILERAAGDTTSTALSQMLDRDVRRGALAPAPDWITLRRRRRQCSSLWRDISRFIRSLCRAGEFVCVFHPNQHRSALLAERVVLLSSR
jgi:hypothetical protein